MCFWLGRTNESLALCRRALELAKGSRDPMDQDRAAKAALIQPQADPAVLRQAVAASRRVLELSSTNDANRAWFLMTAAMGALRDGALTQSEAYLTAAERMPRGPSAEILLLAYRALVLARLGLSADARRELDDLDSLQPAFPARPAPSSVLLDPDLIAAELAREEARTVLDRVAPSQASSSGSTPKESLPGSKPSLSPQP